MHDSLYVHIGSIEMKKGIPVKSLTIIHNNHFSGAGNWTQKPAGQPSAKMQSAVQMQPNGINHTLSALNSAAAAAYRMPNQLTAAQLQQLAAQQSVTQQQLQQLMRSGLLGNPAQQQAAATRQQPQHQQRQSTSSSNGNTKAFPTKLTQIKEFPIEKSNQPPYKLQKALIDNKIVPCINVRPFVFYDLMMTLPGIHVLTKYDPQFISSQFFEHIMKFFVCSN